MRSTRRLVSASLVTCSLGIAVACGHETSTCSDNLALEISEFTVDAYNMVIINSGGSGRTWNWTCPGGGSAVITGTANTSNVTFDVMFTFTNCQDTVLGDTLKLSGVLHEVTTNGASSSTEVQIGHSDALQMYGHNKICEANPIQTTCVVDYNIQTAGDTSSICGIKNP